MLVLMLVYFKVHLANGNDPLTAQKVTQLYDNHPYRPFVVHTSA